MWTSINHGTHPLPVKINKLSNIRKEVGLLKSSAFAKKEVGFLSEFSKVGFVENHGLSKQSTNNVVL